MDHQLERASGIAIYRQIAESIRLQIKSEKLTPGDRIPAEETLAAQFGVAKMTVRQALNELADDGFVVRKHGLGTFVSNPKINRRATRMTGFHEDMLESGMKPHSVLLAGRIEDASPTLQKRLGLAGPEPMVFIHRVRMSGREPAAITASYFRADLCRGLLEMNMEANSLYTLIEQGLNLPLGWVEQRVEAIQASAEAAKYLNLKRGTPILKVDRLTCLKDGRLVGFSESLYRSDRYVLTSVLYR